MTALDPEPFGRAHLESPKLRCPERTWPRWYELDDYRVDNVDPSHRGWRQVASSPLPRRPSLFRLVRLSCLDLCRAASYEP